MSSTPDASGADSERDPRQESIGQLLGELSSDVSTLMRQEFALAQAEMTAKAKAAGIGAGLLARRRRRDPRRDRGDEVAHG